MILILSVIVIASSKSTMLQLKMTNNFKDREFAFQAAETAIKTGENFLHNVTKTELKNIIFNGTNGYYSYDMDRPLKKEEDWLNLNTLGSEQGLHKVTGTPEYIIENIIGVQPLGGSFQVPKAQDSSYFRITSKSKGGTDASLIVLQTIYKK